MSTSPYEIESFLPRAQRIEEDCAHTTLAMYLQLGYEEVVREAPELRGGLTIGQFKRTAEKLGVKLTVLRRVPDLEDFTGVLWLRTYANSFRHTVLCFQGVICDPATGLVWDRETYLKKTKYKVERVLV